MTQATGHRYIVTNDQILSGEPIIEGTRTTSPARLWSCGGKVLQPKLSRAGCRI